MWTLPYRDCRGEHCSPANLAQQCFFGEASHEANGHGRALLAPTMHFSTACRPFRLNSEGAFCVCLKSTALAAKFCGRSRTPPLRCGEGCAAMPRKPLSAAKLRRGMPAQSTFSTNCKDSTLQRGIHSFKIIKAFCANVRNRLTIYEQSVTLIVNP